MKNIKYKNYKLNTIQKNIIIGSILGDANLAMYGRSINAYYREHGCDKQISYREWKLKYLKNLDFKIRYNEKIPSLVSPSHPIYTNLYNLFYIDNVKTITKDNIKLITHPIALACLYMDDGTLVMDINTKKNNIYIFPRIAIYTLCFTKEENQILINHIKKVFDINFKLKYSPYGKNYLLELNKRNEIKKFIDLVKPYVCEVDSMLYKIDLENRLKKQYDVLSKKYPLKNIIISSLTVENNNYSLEDEKLIIKLKQNNVKDREIATILNRSYYGLTDKIRRLRKEGSL